MAILLDEDVELLREKQLAHVGTVGSDGAPQVTPVLIDTDGEFVYFNTSKHRVKYRNLLANPHVAISVADRENDRRCVTIKGTAELIEEGADAHVDGLCKKYFGVDTFPYRHPDDIRVIVKVTPYHRATRNSDPPRRRG